MKTLLIFLFAIVTHCTLIAQTEQELTDYKYLVEHGETALRSEKFDSCIVYYAQAFEIKQTSVLSTLRMAACAYSKGDTELYNEQFAKSLEINWGWTQEIFNNYEEFKYLHSTPFYDRVQVAYRDSAIAAGLDLELMAEFGVIAETDQTQRREMRPISEKYGWESPQMDSLWKLQNYADSVNTLRITQLIDERGYPGKSLVGSKFQSTAFLVIQHADHETQVKYLDVLKAAADAGEVRWSSIALLIDRVRQGDGKMQIYGSQVSRNQETNEFFFAPIEEPYKVDSLRQAVGLGPLTKYAQNWDFEYDPDKHVERHAAKYTGRKWD